jgi:tetratricopeptide (TPR) repeat protein
MLAAGTLVFLSAVFGSAQNPLSESSTGAARSAQTNDAAANSELQTGIDLTRQGRFTEAIPHLLAARGLVTNGFAADFNLALCYVATGQNKGAIPVLQGLARAGHATAPVYNLLTQALVGASRLEEATVAFEHAAALDPKSEKLYLLVADSCMEHGSYGFGVQAITTGLEHLPKSARLHYERGILLSFLDQPDAARKDLQAANELAAGTTLSFLAQAQEGLLNADMAQAVGAAREGLRKEPGNHILLTILGQALIRQGVSPDQPEFAEARTALERSVAERPEYSVSQVALGQLELMAGRIDKAVEHLSKARQLAPDNPAVYSQLAAAYRRRGDLEQAGKALSVLAGLNRQQAAKYKLDPPDHKGSYIGSSSKP